VLVKIGRFCTVTSPNLDRFPKLFQ